MRITRREFLRSSTSFAMATFAGSTIKMPNIAHGMDKKSLVVKVYHSQATSSLSEVNSNVVREMIEKGLMEFTGEKTFHEALAKCLPMLQPNDAVGIKVNTTGYCPSRPELVACVIKGLIETGLKESQIIVFDHLEESMKKLAYWEKVKQDVRYIGTNQLDFDNRAIALIESQRKKVPITKIVSQLCKYIINIPVLRDHIITGLSFSLKNAYGYIPLFGGTRMENRSLISAMHKENGAKQIAELNASPMIKEKTKLIIGDCLLCIINKGPIGVPQWAGNRLIIGQDPVAVDHVALKLLNQTREEKGFREVTGKAGHIQRAATLGVGTNDENKIEFKKIALA